MTTYTNSIAGYIMQAYDELPQRLRELVRENVELKLDPALFIIALEDGMSEDEIINLTKNGRGWWMT